MKLVLLALLLGSSHAYSETLVVPESESPDGKMYAMMDVDRDPKISPEWKEESFPRIEITQKDSGRILESIEYFGAVGDDERPLRENVRVHWRPDSKAFSITIEDRFYSSSKVFALIGDGKFKEVEFPSYKSMTGFSDPNNDELKPKGRWTVEGWDSEGQLILYIFMSPLASYSGNDPLEHTVLLEVTPTKMVTKKEVGQNKAVDSTATRVTPPAEQEPRHGQP